MIDMLFLAERNKAVYTGKSSQHKKGGLSRDEHDNKEDKDERRSEKYGSFHRMGNRRREHT